MILTPSPPKCCAETDCTAPSLAPPPHSHSRLFKMSVAIFFQTLITFIYLSFVDVFECGSEDNLWTLVDSVLTVHHVGSRDRTQIFRLGCSCLLTTEVSLWPCVENSMYGLSSAFGSSSNSSSRFDSVPPSIYRKSGYFFKKGQGAILGDTQRHLHSSLTTLHRHPPLGGQSLRPHLAPVLPATPP